MKYRLLGLFLIFGFVPAFSQTVVPQTFTASGNFVVPAGVTRVTVQAWGGGGGGGGADSNGGENRAGGGGAGGSFTSATNVTVVPGATIPVTVGAGGAGGNGTDTPTSGTTGGTSTFGALVSAVGGAGGFAGVAANETGDGAPTTTGTTQNGGAGGEAPPGGGDGTDATGSGGGGGSGGPGGPGGAAVGSTAGAAGAGGGGAGAPGRTLPQVGFIVGVDATQVGGGGSGGWDNAANNNAGTGSSGGAGFRGQVIVTYTLPDAPTALDLAAADDSNINNDNITSQTSALSISGSSNAGATIQLYDNATPTGTTVVADGTGVWGPIDITLTAGSTHAVTATATLNGNTGAASAALNITIDTSAPTFTSVTANPNTGTSKIGDAIQINFTATGAEATLITGAVLTVNGVNVAGSFTNLTGGNYRVTYIVGALDTDRAAGALPMSLDIRDLAGNTTTINAFSAANALAIDATPPTLLIGTPSTPETAGGPVTFTVTYSGSSSVNLTNGDITLNTTGTATGTVAVTNGTTSTPTVTISSITGNGTLGISIGAGTASDAAGNSASASAASSTFTVDNIPPGIATGLPSSTDTNAGPVSFTITYTGASSINLTTGNITLNTTGSATGTLSVTNGTTSTPTVTISAITGNGTLGISVAAGTATDAAGNVAGAAGPSTNFNVDNTPPGISIGAPSLTLTNTAPVNFNVTYTGTSSVNLTTGNITLNTTGTATGTISVTNGATATPTVTINSISGTGALGISIAAGTGSDAAGNTTPAAGPSATFTVDNMAPVFSATAPAASTFVNNTNVSFTLSEALTSGTITWTEVGGPLDASAPHIQALTGTELNSGAHSNITLTNNPLLVPGAVYTLTFNGTDVAGNPATTVTNANITFDNTRPALSPDEMALNTNGASAETIVFTISETLPYANGTSITGFTTSTGSIASAIYSGQGTTNTITLTSSADGQWTGATTVSYSAGNILDLAANTMLNITNHGLTQSIVNLGAGAIAFTSFKSDDPNIFSIVLLRDVTSGTTIKFTDNGWNTASGGSLRTSEQTFTWTANTTYFAGTEIVFTGNSTSGNPGTVTASHGTISPATGSELLISSSNGDQILAYQGSSTSPTFLAGIQFNNTAWDANGTNDQTSALPPGLTNGINAIALSNVDNGAYNFGSEITSGTVSALRTNINGSSNWVTNNDPASVTLPTAGLTNYIIPPDLTAVSPAHGSVVPATLPNLTITFNDNIIAGTSTGNDIVLRLDNGTFVASWNVGTPSVTIFGATATINTGALTLTDGQVYEIDVASRVFLNADGNGNTSIVGDTQWKFTADALKPTVTSVVRTTPATLLTNATSLTWTVNFSENVNGLGTEDFALFATGTATGTIASVSATSGTSITVAVNGVSGTGDLRLDVPNTATITDNPGNTYTATFTGGQIYSIDQVAPTVSSILRTTPSSALTNSSTVVYTVNFSETVNGLTTGDFTLTTSGSAAGTIASVSAASGSSITVTINSITGAGGLRLNVPATATINDNAGNVLSVGLTGQVYTIDLVRPTVLSINRTTASPTNLSTVTFRAIFSEPVTGVDLGDFTPVIVSGSLSLGVSTFSPVSTTTYDITIPVTGNGVLRLDVDGSTATVSDGATNTLNVTFNTGQIYTIDRTAPVVQSISIDPSILNSWGLTHNLTTPAYHSNEAYFTITFSEPVLNMSTNKLTPSASTTTNTGFPPPSYNLASVTPVDVDGDPAAAPSRYWKITYNNVSGTGSLFQYYNNVNGPLVTDEAGNLEPTNSSFFGSGSNYYYYFALPEPSNHPAFNTPAKTTTSITLNWNHATGPQRATHYLIRAKESSLSFPVATNAIDGLNPANNTEASNDGIWVQHVASNAYVSGPANQTHTFNGLKSGVSYDFEIYPYTFSPNISFLSPNYIDYKNIAPTTLTTTIPVGDGVWLNNNSPLEPASFPSTTTTSASSVINFRFQIWDDAYGDFDNASTKITKIKIRRSLADDQIGNWTNALDGVEITDGITTKPGVIDPSGNFIEFDNLYNGTTEFFGEVPDEGNKYFSLKLILKSSLLGGLQQTIDNKSFVFAMNNIDVTVAANSSQLNAQNDLFWPVKSDINKNKVDVFASKLVFTTDVPTSPSQIGVKTNFPVPPIVKALDVNDNLDLNYNNSFTPTTSITAFNGHPNFVNGVLTLSNFHFTQAGTSTITIAGNAGGVGPVYPALSGSAEAVSSSITAVISTLTQITSGPGSEPASFPSITTALTGAPVGQMNAVQNFDFTVTDDVGANTTNYSDNDGLPTLIRKITIIQGSDNGDNTGGTDALTFDNWTKVIGGAQISDGTNSITIGPGPNITASSLIFNIPAGSALETVADGASKNYQLKIWLKNPVDTDIRDILDGKDFSFAINQGNLDLGTDPNATSTLSISNASTSDGTNEVTVTTTQLDFVTQPPATQNYDANLTVTPIVKARDANQNLDINYSSNATLNTVFIPSAAPNNIPHTYPLSNTAFNFVGGVVNLNSVAVSSSGGGIHNDKIQLRLDDTPNVGSVASGSSSDVILTYSNSSDIVRDGTFTHPTNIVSINNRESGNLTAANSIALDRFLMRDGGASDDDDGSKTKLQSITFNVTNHENIRKIGIYDESDNEIQELDSTAFNTTGDITFSTLATFEANDNDRTTKKLTVRASFRAFVADNEQINVSIISATANGVSSQLIPTLNVAGDNLGPDKNKLEVVATKIVFTTIPTSTSINLNILVVTEAQDAFGNHDVDYNGSVSFTGNGNTSNYGVANLPSGSFAGGLLNYPANFHFTSGTSLTRLTINGGAANSAGLSVDAGAITGISAAPGIDVQTSYDSWLYFDPLFSYTTRIPFVNMQETTLTNSANSVELARLILSDGGALAAVKNAPVNFHDDTDGADTEISQLTISLTNFNDIQKIAIFDAGGNKIGSDQNGAATVTFSGLNVAALTAPDDDVVKFYIRASFKPTVGADGDQIQIQITNVVWDSGSQFPLTDGTTTQGGVDGTGSGGDESDPTKNIIDVVATSLDFVTQPSDFAGINQPIDGTTGGNTGVVHARDKFENLDTEFSYSISISAPATPTNHPLAFTNGILNLSAMEYRNAGDGTLVVESNGLNSSVSSSGNSEPCEAVDVIHVTATEDRNNGVILSESLKGGTTNQRIFGLTIDPQHATGSEPLLSSFSIVFRNKVTGNPYPFTTGSSTIFKNFKIYQVVDNTLTLLTDPTDIDLNTTQSGALAALGAPSTFLDKLEINFVNDVPIYDGRTYSYYLAVDVDVSANVGTTPITPYVIDLGYGTNSNNHIQVTQGSSSAFIEGITRKFASTKPPVLVKTYPENGKLNVDPALDTIKLYFDVPVVTFDGVINLYNRTTGTKVATLQAVNGFYQNGTPIGGQTANPLKFVLPAGLDLKKDTVYYVTIEKGRFSNINATDRAGISDEGFNLFGGISYNGTFYFKAASPNPPVLLGTDENKYAYTPTTASFNVKFNQAGTVHYMVVDPAGAPSTVTNNQILGIDPYTSGTVIVRDSVKISQINPNYQYTTISANLAIGTEYPVYIFAKNDAEPVPVPTAAPYGDKNSTYAVGGTGPTIKLKKTISNTNRYSFPRYEICSGSVVRLQEPLVISEVGTSEFATGFPLGTVQSFNILLPTGFQFDVTKQPNIEFNGADFGTLPVGNVSHNFINTTLLQIKYVSTGTASRDNIVISDLFVIASSNDLTGPIERFSGSGLSIVPELQDLARITSTPATSIPFTNTYDLANNFSSKYPSEIAPDEPVTYIPDSYRENGNAIVRLIPLAPAGDYGASFFSGSGLTGDILTLSAVQLDAPFNINLTHTDQNGCISTAAEQYAVYDHTRAIPELLSVDGDIKVCISNPNFPANPDPMLVASDSVSFVGLAGYQLINLFADIPKKEETTTQIMQHGSAWQNLVKNIPIVIKQYPNANLGKVFKTYNWDYVGLIHNDSLSKHGLINPYVSNFSEPLPSGQTYYKGGSLGLIEFTGVYQSTADFGVFIPFRQEVEIFVPAIPLIEIDGKPTNETLIFCKDGADIQINGYPAASAGASRGIFVLSDSLDGSIIYDFEGGITSAGFTDNGNGTATLDPSNIFNDYTTIRIDYTYQDNNSPCSKTATSYIKITPNPVAQFTAKSIIGVNTPVETAYCENRSITFDASGSSFFGVAPNLYKWDFSDAANTSNKNPNIVSSDTAQIMSHTFATSARYNVSLTVTSVYGCESTIQPDTIDVGAIPIVKFGFTGESTADQIEFNITGTEIRSAQIINDYFDELLWNYNHGTPQTVTSNFQSPVSHNYPNPNLYNVSLQVKSRIGCTNRLVQPIIVLAREIPQENGAYFEGFESSNGDWQPSSLPTTSNATNPYSWAHGTPSTSVIRIDPTINGSSVWKTSLTDTYNPKEESALYSPSFDLRNLTRPMISFNIFTQVENSDGVVLEYSVDGKNVADPTKRWDAVGQKDEGVYWFNGSGITAKPGDQPSIDYGWTGFDTTRWMEAKHAIANEPNKPPIVGASSVVFRFALASVKQDRPSVNGFAIDNFRIGNRTRIVLVENFRNLGNGATEARSNGTVVIEKDETDFFTQNFSPVGNDTSVIRINYHVGFPSIDPLNNDNAQDPGARALYYNLAQTPRATMDGAQPLGATYFSTWGLNQYNIRSLKLADAEINANVTTNADGTGINVTVKALKDLGPRTILHLAVVERSVSLSSMPTTMQSLVKTGETNFDYVVKKLLPNAAGTKFNVPLLNEDSRTFNYTWSESIPLYNPVNDLYLIMFLQDEGTKEIYQTEIKGLQDPGIVTGIEDPTNTSFKVYPNPTDKEMTVELPEMATENTPLQVFDQLGKVVQQATFEKGDTTKTIDTNDLAGGVYVIQIESKKGMLRRKVLVLHRN